MKIDISPLIHAAIAAAIQIIIGYLTNNWILGGVCGCMWFIAREHTQAEYRWIATYGRGKRNNMPWYGGIDPKAWDVASVLDFAVPVVVCSGLAAAHRFLSL